MQDIASHQLVFQYQELIPRGARAGSEMVLVHLIDIEG